VNLDLPHDFTYQVLDGDELYFCKEEAKTGAMVCLK